MTEHQNQRRIHNYWNFGKTNSTSIKKLLYKHNFLFCYLNTIRFQHFNLWLLFNAKYYVQKCTFAELFFAERNSILHDQIINSVEINERYIYLPKTCKFVPRILKSNFGRMFVLAVCFGFYMEDQRKWKTMK